MRKTKKTIATLAIVAMMLTMIPMQAFAAGTDDTRIAGSSRIQTAIAAADAGWTSADTAILAPSADANLVDALAAAPLAGQEDAPILLTEGNKLNAETKAELVKLGVSKVYVIGAIDDAVTAEVEAMDGVTATALKGASRYETAAKIADELTAPAGTFIVGANATADALSVASYAAANNYAILLAGADGKLPASETAVGSKTYLVGGSTLVADVAGATRLSGTNRYETNKAVVNGLSYEYSKVYVANGQNGHLVDSLIASSLAAKTNSPILLTDNKTVAAAADVNKNLKSDSKVIALGGTSVVSDTVKGGVKYTAPTALAVESVSAITNNRVDVTLSSATTVAPAVDKFSIKDAAGNALTVTGTALSSDGKAVKVSTAAQTPNILYTLTVEGKDYKFVGLQADATKPQLSSAVATKNTKVELAFNENVDETALNIANYTIAGLSILKAEYKLDADGNPIKTNILLTTSTQTQGTIYKAVANVTDFAGNAIDADYDEFQFGGLAADTTKPQLLSAVALTNSSVKVTFDDDMDKASAENIANYTIAGLAVLKAELSADKTYVTLTTAPQAQGTIYKVVVANVTDEAGNVLNADNDEFQFGGLAADTTKPQLTSAVALTNTSVKVSFNDIMDKASAENIANYSISGLTVTKAVLDPTTKAFVTLTTSAQTQGTIYKVVVSNVADASANAIDADYDEFQFGGLAADTTKPTVTSATMVDNTHVKVTFSEVMDAASATKAYNYYLGTELGYPTSVAKDTTVTDGTVWVLTTKSQAAKVYTIDVTGVTDLSGNAVDEDNDTATFGGIAAADATAPKVSSAVATNINTVVVTFNEAIDDATVAATDFTFTVQSGTETATNKIATAVNPSAVTVSEDGKTATMQFATATMTSGVIYKVEVAGVNDLANNPINTTYDYAVFAGITSANAAPKVSSAVLVNNQTLKITFSEPVSVSAPIVGGDFTYTTGSNAYAGTFETAVMSSDNTSVTVYYSGATFDAGKLYTVRVNNARFADELSLVGLSNAVVSGTTQANDSTFAGISAAATAPKISAVIAVDANTLDITFDQAVTSTLGVGDFTVTENGNPVSSTVALVRAEGTDGNKVRVFFDGTPFTAGHVYKVAVTNTDVKNLNGTAMSATANYGTFAAISTPNTAPKLVGAQKVDATHIKVTFSEKVTNVAALGTDFTVTGGTIAAADLDLTDTTGKTVILTVNPGMSAGIHTVDIADTATIKDEASVGTVDVTSKIDFVY